MDQENQTTDSVPPSPDFSGNVSEKTLGSDAPSSPKQEKITIATVTWNAGDLISRTIHSVESQDYPAVEHLIIDGNSHDDTLTHVHHYQERNSRAQVRHEIVCISEPDEGIYDAMNKALRMATGRYILFLNAGDTLHSPSTLSQVATLISDKREAQPAVIYGDTDIVDDQGHFIRRRRLTPPEHLTWRSFREGMLVCHQAFFARTDIARQHLYDTEHYRFSADFDWCIRIMQHAERVTPSPLPLVNAHLTVADYLSEGTTTRNHRASLRERFHIMSKHYGLLPTLMRHAWFVVRTILKR